MNLSAPSKGTIVIGRDRECAELTDLLAQVRSGRSQVLVVRGEAGVGKTSLLEYLHDQSRGYALIAVSGVESEMELAYAGLHQLCLPLLDHLDRIPEPQRDALRSAFGVGGGTAPDRLLIGLALLSLLSEASRRHPVICTVDDAQWIDRASIQAIAFAARRLAQEPVGIVFVERDPGGEPELQRLPELHLGGLADAAARALLAAVVTGPMDEQVRDRIVAETRGNPLALLQLPRGLTPAQIAGGFGLFGQGALTTRVAESFHRRLEALPAATRRLLVVAAAEPGQDAVLIWRAAEQLDVQLEDAEPAVTDGLIELTGQVRFCHPLARSTVYRAAPPDERRAAHGALAQATDPDVDPDRRAWHRAHATAGLDEDVAAELERSATRAQARGGIAAAAAFHERAAELTPDPARRATRALVAAWAKYQAASPERALRLLAIAESGAPDELARARVERVRAVVTNRLKPADGGSLLVAAKRLELLDPELARDTYRDAFWAARIAGRLGRDSGLQDVAAATRAKASPNAPENVYDRLLDGLATVIADGYAAGAPLAQQAVTAVRTTDMSTETAISWLPFATRIALDVWDDQGAHDLATRMIAVARDCGALNVLPIALMLEAGYQQFAGDLATVGAVAQECELISEATNVPTPAYDTMMLAAWRGQDQQLATIIDKATTQVTSRGEGQWFTAVGWARSVLNNGLGRYDEALLAAEQGSAYPDELGIANWTMVELIEAAARSGLPARAAAAMARLSDMADACRTGWVLGVAARSRGLLSHGDAAEAEYRAAIEHLSPTGLRTELARAQLVYGEWLRRENRRIDAREQLRQAHDAFSDIGAEAFAARARRELLATGETVRKRVPGTQTQLTEQETQIVRLAVHGRTNPEIATRLFISPRTVEWHLRKVFGKLGINSRRELASAVPDHIGGGSALRAEQTSPQPLGRRSIM